MSHFLFAITLATTFATAAEGQNQPNIVMIISDDQSYHDFGFMGNSVVQTPHLDALASRSARFINGYVPSSVCRPSLVTLLTGLYPHQHGVHFNHPPPGFATLTRSMNRAAFDAARQKATDLIRQVPTLPRLLAANGYRCLQTGKYWEGHWQNAGFTDGMTRAHPVPGARYGNKRLANGDLVAHGNGDAGLSIGRETMEPVDAFLAEVQKDPFFIWYAPFLPHLPHDSPQVFFDAYDADVEEHLRFYYAACTQFDHTVGELLQRVERHASDRETLVVFVVDNGFRPDPNQPMRDGFGFNYTRRSKRSPFEDGVRTPILISQGSKSQSATHDVLCSSVDLMPTILHAASIEPPPSLSGRSLWSLVVGEHSEWNSQAVFGEIYPGDASVLGNPAADVAYRWVRQGDFKLIVPHVRRGKVWGGYGDAPQLYDLKKDPGERTNLATRPEYAQQKAELEDLLNRWWTGQSRIEKE